MCFSSSFVAVQQSCDGIFCQNIIADLGLHDTEILSSIPAKEKDCQNALPNSLEITGSIRVSNKWLIYS